MAELPGRPFQRMAQAQQNFRAANPGGLAERIGGLLAGGNPLFDIGVGLLAASGPSVTPVSTGQALASAVQFASDRQRAAMENHAIREQLLALQQQRQQQSALADLISSLSKPGEVTPADGVGPPATTPPQLSTQQAQILQMLAQQAPAAALQILAQHGGLLGQAEPTGLEAKLATVQSAIGRELTESEVLSLAGSGGTTINVGGDKSSEPIPVSELANIRTSTGEALPVGATYADAIAAGARVFSQSDRQRQQQLEGALDVLGELKSQAIGEDGIFHGIPTNLLGRYAKSVQFAIEDVLGTEGSVRRDLYRDLSRGVVGPLVRSLGESGSLAEGDVARAIALLPDNSGLLPESGKLAEAKLRELEGILQKAVQNLSGGSGAGGNAFDLGGGVTLEFID